jgi:hypothetical protein
LSSTLEVHVVDDNGEWERREEGCPRRGRG